MHEVFEHTADLGLRIRTASQAELFAEAAMALRELMVTNAGNETEQRQITLTQSDPALLFFDWLNELLYLFDAERYLTQRATVSIVDGTLNATLYGEPLDNSRHQLDYEVKAITYHQLKAEQLASGEWLAEVILDI